MADISAADVKTLRDRTGAGMMDCKKALQEAEGDVERATTILREKGAAKAVKRAERAMKEGRITLKIADDKSYGVLVEVNTETDFSARSERFGDLVNVAVESAFAGRCSGLESLLAAKPVGSGLASIQDVVTETVSVIGENMAVSRCSLLAVPEKKRGLIHGYIHPPGRVGVLVALDCDSEKTASAPETRELAQNLCLHIAFSAPVSIDSSSISQETIDAEKEIYRVQARQEGKPENILDKIVEGKIKGYFKESCLLEQAYVKDEKKSIDQVVRETANAAGGTIKIAGFVRYQLGQ